MRKTIKRDVHCRTSNFQRQHIHINFNVRLRNQTSIANGSSAKRTPFFHVPLGKGTSVSRVSMGLLTSDFFRSRAMAFSTMLPFAERSIDRSNRERTIPAGREISDDGGRIRPGRDLGVRPLVSECGTRCDDHSDTVRNSGELAALSGEHLARVGQLDHAAEAPPLFSHATFVFPETHLLVSACSLGWTSHPRKKKERKRGRERERGGAMVKSLKRSDANAGNIILSCFWIMTLRTAEHSLSLSLSLSLKKNKFYFL